MSKRQRDIKTKLMAAVAMLLVSSIMMVSTTYAWFTLSTAPEVTGITTAVGANGNLEMALMPLHGDVTKITSSAADSMVSQVATKANITWGNLVDLGAKNAKGENAYGLHEITLYPAKLNGTDQINTAAPLSIPKYGSDGRVSELDSTSTVTGVYVGDDFYQSAYDESNTSTDNPTGVRVIGTVSGMTEQQSAFRGALAAASTVALNARNEASAALKLEGPKLADIAIEHATSDSESYTESDLQSLLNMVNALLGTDEDAGALGMIEAAMRQYLYAIKISTDTNYASFEGQIVGTEAEAAKSFAELDDAGLVPDTMDAMINALNTTLTNANTAKTNLENLIKEHKASYAWTEFDDEALTLLANPNSMKINGIEVSKLKDNAVDENGDPILDKNGKPVTNMGNLVASVMTSGLNLILASGSGVYSDVADFCGDYSADIIIPEITYGVTVPDVPASMKTKTTLKTVYMDQADDYVRNVVKAPAGGDTETLPITDYYGYIIDLAFRTNAADSHLQLQTEGVDRVYDGNTQNEATMGGGSTMTFKWNDTAAVTGQDQTVLNNKAAALMEHIKVIFFDPVNQNTILAYGKLNGKQTTDTATNEISVGLTLADAAGEPVENLMELEQNKAHRVSVLVYLDGETLTNADVAYTSATSMTGSLNLQFCSSAELKPMEYSDLRTGTGDSGSSTPVAPTISDVTATITTGYAATAKYIEGVGIAAVITETTGNTEVTTGTVTIDSKNATYMSVGDYSAWVVTADAAPTGSVAITVA